jgi:hypothetical protein
LISKETKGLL